MRSKTLWLTFALIWGMVLVGLTGAEVQQKKGQPPQGKKDGPPRGFGGPGGGFGGVFFPGDSVERALNELNLSDKAKKEKAEAVVKEYRENVRKVTDLARSDLLLKMNDLLSEEEFKTFKAAVDRQPVFADGPIGFGVRGGPGRGF